MADPSLLGLPEAEVDTPEGDPLAGDPPEPTFIVLFPRGVDAGEEGGADTRPRGKPFRNRPITMHGYLWR